METFVMQINIAIIIRVIYTSAKGAPASNNIIIAHSRHTEVVCFIERAKSPADKPFSGF